MSSWLRELELQAGAQQAQIEQILGTAAKKGYYGFAGTPIEPTEWAALFDSDYRVVNQEQAQDGSWVSTVWMGLHLGDGDSPLIFETMVFEDREPTGEIHRWPNAIEAEAGHDEVVRQHGGVHNGTSEVG